MATTFSIDMSKRKNLQGYRNLIGDCVKPWLFALELPPLQIGGFDSLDITTLVSSTTLPGYNISTQTHTDYNGLLINSAKSPEYSETLDINFPAVDATMVLYKLFLGWMAMTSNPINNISSSMSSYKFNDIKVHQLDRHGIPILTYNFFGVFCKKVSGWEVGQKNTAIPEFKVSLKYDFYTIDTRNLTNGIYKATPDKINISTSHSNTIAAKGFDKKGIPSNQSVDGIAKVVTHPKQQSPSSIVTAPSNVNGVLQTLANNNDSNSVFSSLKALGSEILSSMITFNTESGPVAYGEDRIGTPHPTKIVNVPSK